MSTVASAPPRPPRDGLVRALPTLEYRDESTDDTPAVPTLRGHFARFNEWTLIDSMYEGKFMERVAPGAFKKTFAEQRDGMRVLFQHGHDPHIGDKPLGPIAELREDDEGAYYEVPLLDTEYNRELIPGLEAGLYGASFRFSVTRDHVEDNPRKVANDDGIPERTIQEARVMEFGPVTFPAYDGATAGMRSMTDEYVMRRFAADPEQLERLVTHVLQTTSQRDALPADDPITTTSVPQPTRPDEDEPEPDVRQRTPLYTPAPRPVTPLYGMRDTRPAWRI